MNETNQEVVQTVSGPSYGFDCPDAIVFDGTNIWVTNRGGNSLTEFNASTGLLVRIITSAEVGSPSGLDFKGESPSVVLAYDGTNIWVASEGSVSEFNASTGLFVKTLTPNYKLHWQADWPSSLTFLGNKFWITNFDSWAFELDASTGNFIRQVQLLGKGEGNVGASHGASIKNGILWVSDRDQGTVTEFSASTGRYIRTVRVSAPAELICDGSHLFVLNEASTTVPDDSVQEYSSTGVLLRTIIRSNRDRSVVGGIGGQGISAMLLVGNDLWITNYRNSSVTKINL